MNIKILSIPISIKYYKKFSNFFSIMKRINSISITLTLTLIFIMSIIFIMINYNNKIKENMNNNKCCNVEIDKNYNDQKIGTTVNKSKLAVNKLCCNNPELVNCDC